jgi:hypothetical protein
MSKGLELAKFNLECSTATCTAGPAGTKILAFNFFGPATGGFGTVVGTLTFDTGKGGNMEFCGVAFMDNGDIFNSSATGTFKPVGKHQWSTQMLLHNSDGGVMLSEGFIDLASTMWTGTIFEWLAEQTPRTSSPLQQYRNWLRDVAA